VGEGLQALLGHAAAEVLGCAPDLVRVLPADTSRVCDLESFMTPVGLLTEAVRDAAKRVRGAMDAVTADAGFQWREAVEACVRRRVPLMSHGFAIASESADGSAVTTAANVVEVEVDTETGGVRVLRVHSAHDAGRVLDPINAEGQLEGGIVQGLGFALLEGHRVEEGRLVEGDLSRYLVPTSMDAPEIQSLLVEQLDEGGHDRVQLLGEAPMVGVAPAVAAAVYQAVGVRFHELPILPEAIRKALRERRPK
jgi:CO/xanthine dehydrogenase Mo-binding subunit